MDEQVTISISRRGLRIALATAVVVGALVPVVAVAAGGTFIDDDNSIFEADIEWMAANGITTGCNPPTNDRYCPQDPVTRGQMAAFMRRLATKNVVDAATAVTAAAAANAGLLDGRDSTDFLGATAKAADAGLLDGRDSTDFLGATEQAADSDTVDGLHADDLAPSFLAANQDGAGLTLTGQPVICETSAFTPTKPMTALILTETAFQAPGGGDIQWGTKAAYSTNGGATWTEAVPDWWLRVTSPAGEYNGLTSNGLVELDAGTTYLFAHRTRRFAGQATTAEYICKTLVQIVPRTAGTGITQLGPAVVVQGSQLP